MTFGENSAGGAVVQGSYVSAGQSHVRSSNPRFRSGGVGESREQTLSRAREAIQRMGRANRVSTSTCEKALRWFNLALDGVPEVPLQSGLPQPKNYILGRKQEYTVAACLYVACRYAKTSHLLIDFAEAIDVSSWIAMIESLLLDPAHPIFASRSCSSSSPQINVFSLGRHYLKLVAALNIKLPVIDPSFYVLRFASLLDFGDETNKVAQDATRLCARFKKDWLGDGRRPAGICGAALLLAARMNNFQRSMNEIVQVVKMADVTIRERLEEFKRTPSGNLTVQDFKEIWLEEEHEPPAFYRPQLEKEMKNVNAERLGLKGENQRGRRGAVKAQEHPRDPLRYGQRAGDTAGNDYDDEQAEDRAVGSSASKPATAVLRQEEDRQELSSEMDALVEEATRQEIGLYTQDEDFKRLAAQAEKDNLASQRRARLGTKAILGSGAASPPTGLGVERSFTGDRPQYKRQRPDSLVSVDHERSAEIGRTSDDSDMDSAHERHCVPSDHGLVEPTAGPSQMSDAAHARKRTTRETTAPPATAADRVGPIDTLSDLDEDELDQFILGQDEVRIKERVWMEFNHDYLQDALHRRLKEEADVKAGIFKRRSSRKRGSVKGPDRESNNLSASTAEEATKHMLLRKKTSKKLNYGAIENLFSGQRGATGRGVKQRRHVHSNDRHKQDAPDTEAEPSDKVRQGVAAGRMSDAPEEQEESGNALPTTYPLCRSDFRAEAKRRRRAGLERPERPNIEDSGDESGGHAFGAALSDGATTEGDGADDAEAALWGQHHMHQYMYGYDEGVDD